MEQGLGCIRVSFLSVFLKGLASVAQLQSLATCHPEYTLSLHSLTSFQLIIGSFLCDSVEHLGLVLGLDQMLF